MRFDAFLQQFSAVPLIDLPMILQISGESRAKTLQQLHLWARKGLVLRLRRGIYMLAEVYRKTEPSPYFLANELLRPSYVSTFSAFQQYGLIPEMVVQYTSVTTRTTRTFQNAFGVFRYSALKTDFFWGYRTMTLDGTAVKMAEPEKALLDFFHLTKGAWTEARLMEMRFQSLAQIDWKTLAQYVDRWGSPRLARITQQLRGLYERGIIGEGQTGAESGRTTQRPA